MLYIQCNCRLENKQRRDAETGGFLTDRFVAEILRPCKQRRFAAGITGISRNLYGAA